jgi:dihydropteroate synthase
MGILNVTPDSFFATSRCRSEEEIRQRVCQIRQEGATMVDIGAYSSRPGAEDVFKDEELRRLLPAIDIVREEWPEAIISVDTFRAEVARRAVEAGADIINDISGGEMDKDMFATVAKLGVAYVLMHMQGTPQSMQESPQYGNVALEVARYLAERVQRLRDLGQKDIILDPGFGFGKTLRHNYELLESLDYIKDMTQLPLLVGVSRKSMVYRPLGISPEEALNGTTVLNTMALMKGADVLRVHDVKACAEAVELFMLTKGT